MSRGGLLAISVAFSLVLHAALLAVAPRIQILRPSEAPAEVLSTFEVKLLDEERLQAVDELVAGTGARLTSQPGAIEDLLARDPGPVTPGGGDGPGEVPNLGERLAAEQLPREHDLTPDPTHQRLADTRIIEISESVMREDIDVARRFVRPSPARILPEDALPVLRAPSDPEREALIRVDPLAMGDGAGAGDGPDPLSGENVEEGEARADEPEALAELEKVATQAPVHEEVAQEAAKYTFMDELVDVRLETYRPSGEAQGYFRLSIVPRDGAEVPVLPKDVTFVLDASNSILQRKLRNTAEGVAQAVRRLRPGDRFNIVVFRDTPDRFRPARVAATDANKSEALEFLAGLESRGETDVYEGIRPVVGLPAREGVPGIVLVATDGRPTEGLRDGRAIINALTEANTLRNSVYAFGGGRTVNRYLLDLLAYRNKGESFVVDDIAEIDERLPQFFATLEDPLLVDCRADFGRVNEAEVYPRELPDFYRGQAVTVYGRFDPDEDGAFAMRLAGRAGPREKEVIFQQDLADAEAGDASVAHDWAFRKAYHVIGEICRVGETPELLAELRSLRETYGIQTSYTD
jgi:hypothetical protein